jgi:hypothetical protein
MGHNAREMRMELEADMDHSDVPGGGGVVTPADRRAKQQEVDKRAEVERKEREKQRAKKSIKIQESSGEN